MIDPKPKPSEPGVHYFDPRAWKTSIKSRIREEFRGKTLGFWNLDDGSTKSTKSCYCLAVSEKWFEKGGEKTLNGVDVLIVRVQRSGDLVYARRLGTGYVSEMAWYDTWERTDVVMT